MTTTDAVVVGADLGTSGLKLAALDDAGLVVAESEAAYDVDRPRPGWAQTAVEVWLRALDDARTALVHRLGGRPVAALGLSGQMHGAVLVDAAGAALAPALLWPDQRATAELQRWRELPAGDRAALANPLAAGMTGPLLAWLAAHEPGLVARAATVLLPKDAVRAALVPGADPAVTDRSDASATLLWDVPRERWSAAATAAAGVDAGLLPAVRPGHEVVGTTGLLGGDTPVVVGGADTPLALLAAGTGRGVQVNLGSGAQLLRPRVAPAPAADPVVHCFADAEDGWYAMAALQNAGTAWSWVGGVLGLDWAGLAGSLAASPLGAGGVSFAPFLTGERGGVAGPGARGSWTGLSAGTTRADLARAALEGVVCAVAAGLDLLGPGDDELVVLTGGGARDPGVQQLLADVLGRPVQHVQVRSASAAGAAVLAARGVGLDLVPQRVGDPVVEPREQAAAAVVRERWAART
ncbi:FGGY family carbohydrate kinase [Modestobacter sp. VKM Ac-2986]|uniref:FGGY family carbohydrate kinase n=1 Tax=Modestobacter sp. VKM Ac-2986 TaxID=3004140 RepID=UPI0022ABBCCA|nr:FGGY family carbohydrate kinase [Modestobacter sp. VKM Ac-2986]MCZ2829632.1 FGGY family carbohydrate kinase [Modestobacter sp. VKM Ac-2986]